MNHAEHRLIAICDDLLSTTGRLRAACEKAGNPWPTPEAAALIDRLLDLRSIISNPHPIKQP